MARVAIIGTGLIGASIGLALHALAEEQGIEVVGHDSSRERLREAERRKAIGKGERNIRHAVDNASLVILATPILAMRETMRDIAGQLMPNAIVTDTGSTKAQVLRWAEEILPRTINFVGGHPMAGKTEVGATHAEATLFEGARWVLVPSRHASAAAIETIAGLATSLGARPMYMDAEEHDAYVAAISHLPLFAASALFRVARDSEAWPELSLLAASGFRDTTRLAGSDEEMAHDIAATNRDQLIHWLQRYRGILYDLEDMLRDTDRDEDLLRFLTQLNFDYTGFLNGERGRVEIDQKGSQASDISITDFLLGGSISERLRKLTDIRKDDQERSERRGRSRGG